MGCTTNAGTGVSAGASLGAGAGGLIGGTSGALIGAAAGVLSGGLIGYGLDRQDRNVMEQSSPRTVERIDRKEPLTLSDVIKLSLSGVSDDTILRYMQETKSSYELSRTQIRRLQESGVSQRVLNYMIDSKVGPFSTEKM
jgi:uncharacterized protein YcfJ